MSDFKTPLPIHRAAFGRVAPGLGLPDVGKERLRTAFQAAERRGLPFEDVARAVSEAVGEFVWTWPWLEQQAERLARRGLVPLDWTTEAIRMPFDWHQVPHAVRVRLLTGVMFSAVQTEGALAEMKSLRDGVVAFHFALRCDDPRCPASVAMVGDHHRAVTAGDASQLPPFFPGDHCSLRIERVR